MARDAATKSFELIMKETQFSGLTAVGGAALAFYTNEHSANPIWPVAYSVVSSIGIYTVMRNMRKVRNATWYENVDEYSLMNVATGTIVYFSSLYAFSESWKCSNLLWILCLGTAAHGLFFASSYIYRTERISDLKFFPKFCELAFKPALIGLGATYLWYFRNHDEEFLQWIPLVLILCDAILHVIDAISLEVMGVEPKSWLLKGIKLYMGGCLQAVSSTALIIYFSVKEYHWILRACMGYNSFSSIFNIFASITCFQVYIGMEKKVLCYLICLTTGFAIVLASGLMVQYLENKIIKYLFPIWSASGYYLLYESAYHICQVVSRPVINRYLQRTLAPLFTILSTVASAYVGYHMGWRYFMMVLPLPWAGIYVAYKGFRRAEES